MTRRILAVIAAIATAACTPVQIAAWHAWHQTDPGAAEQFAHRDDIQAELVTAGTLPELTPGTLPPVAEVVDGVPCGQWAALTRAAGLPDRMLTIMWRESRCQPDAHNPSGASGLLQIMPMWADDCGTTRSGLFDPAINIACARHILTVQGIGAWSTA